MKNPVYIIIVTFIIIMSNLTRLNAQNDNTFTSYGKPLALVFSNVNYSINKNGNNTGFELTRVYLGYEYFFSRNISSKVNFDIGNPGVGKLQMTAYIKNAYVQYKNNGLAARIGMIGVNQFSIQEKQWGYRYLYKSFQDEYNFGPSADLGFAFEYSPSDFISVDLSVLNGEGYKKLQADSVYKSSVGLTMKPLKGLVLRAYYDRMTNNFTQSSYAFYAGYNFKDIRLGIEYNKQMNNGMINSHDFSGYSFYSAMNVNENISVFARYDNLTSIIPAGDTDRWNITNDGQLFLAGFDYSPVSGIKIAPTFIGWSPDDITKSFTSTFALNFEIRF